MRNFFGFLFRDVALSWWQVEHEHSSISTTSPKDKDAYDTSIKSHHHKIITSRVEIMSLNTMKIVSSYVLLALLSNTETSFSFLITSGRQPMASASASSAAQSKTRLLYYGDYDDNYLHFNSDTSDATSYLHRIGSTLRGGTVVDNSEYGVLNSLSVSELKRLLTDRGVDFRDCLEKRDLVERIISSKASAVPTSHATDGGGYNNGGVGGLSYEENRVVNTFTRASPAVAYIQTISQSMQMSRGFSLKEVPTGAGSGFLWDEKAR